MTIAAAAAPMSTTPSALATPSTTPPRSGPGPGRRTLTTAIVDDTVAAAAALLRSYDVDSPGPSCSLFLDCPRHQATAFLRAAADLHRAMLFYAAHGDTAGRGLVQAQHLLDIAMRRLQLELQLLLLPVSASATSTLSLGLPNKPLDYQYQCHDDDDQQEELPTTTHHIRTVVDAMLATGHGKECVSTFKDSRRAALAATLHRLLGFPPSSHHKSSFQKLSWDQVDARLQSWLAAVAVAVAYNSVFPEERELCDTVFKAHADKVFAAVASDHATSLLSFAEAAVARARRAPERLFRVLDVHDALTGTLLPAILALFGDRSAVATRARAALSRVGEEARGAVASFEAAIHKESSKASAPGGAVHPLTRYVMNYLVLLADYDDALAYIYRQQGRDGSGGSASPDLSFSSSSTASTSTLSLSSNPIGWLVFTLVLKVDAMAGRYREAALSYLFLANNTHYVGRKAGRSSRMAEILGEEWAEETQARARGFVHAYARAAWGISSKAATISMAEAAVMEAVATQDKWVAADEELGEELRAAVAAALMPAYRVLYRRHGAAVRLTPGDVNAMIAGLFRSTTTTTKTRNLELVG